MINQSIGVMGAAREAIRKAFLPAIESLDSPGLAPGVSFDEGPHKYWYKGKELSGITRRIGAHLGTKINEAAMGAARDEGNHVHHAVQFWVNSGCSAVDSVHPGVAWIAKTFITKAGDPLAIRSETLVSDFKQYASGVDLLSVPEPGWLDLWDMKRTFKRTSVTWQLSIYKYLIETYTAWRVRNLWCISYHSDKEYFPIISKTKEEVEELLYGKE